MIRFFKNNPPQKKSYTIHIQHILTVIVQRNTCNSLSESLREDQAIYTSEKSQGILIADHGRKGPIHVTRLDKLIF